MNTTHSNLLREIKKLDLQKSVCERLAYKVLEERVRTVLKGKNAARNFCMAMGQATFYNKEGNSLDHDLSYLKDFYAFADAMNERFNIFGWPMKIKNADEPIIFDW